MATEITAEIVDTPEGHAQGLMGRKKLGDNSGMLFVFPRSKRLSFWMANTYIPLDIAFVGADGRIRQIEKMSPLCTKSIPSRDECRYALEVNEGWFSKNGIEVGAQVAMPPMEPSPGVDQSTQGGDPMGGMEGLPGQDKQQPAPELKIKQDNRQILEAVKAHGVRIMIQFETMDGNIVPAALIDPDFTFVDGRKERDDRHPGINSQILAFDNRHGHEIRIIIDNIKTIADEKGNPISSVNEVEQLAKGKPLTREEDAIAKGKEARSPELSNANQVRK
jgi:uncharacterized membrane protein (UPF0127 family)